MPDTPEQTDAIAMIGDWSKWIAAVETGAIAAIAAFVKPFQINLCLLPRGRSPLLPEFCRWRVWQFCRSLLPPPAELDPPKHLL
jgi:hypothetical protein